uniref:Uncharacterized protein LOC102802720 n=1 Tax=Saccoglossus kowalevskii TaxID=10224 RepID=A0ABM0MPT1_SACKO|nr:PREDICTED: uncharacterized protein LOC102802720 [Saccoglossus kowalevskii]
MRRGGAPPRRSPKSRSDCPSSCHCAGDAAICWQPFSKDTLLPSKYKTLQVVDMSVKDITTILVNTPSIETLVLRDSRQNRITSVPTDFFSQLVNLKFLNIPTMRRRELPLNIVQALKHVNNLEKLNIDKNKMPCSCDLLDLVDARGIELIGPGFQPVRGCKRNGFPIDTYNFDTFVSVCDDMRSAVTDSEFEDDSIQGIELTTDGHAITTARFTERGQANVEDPQHAINIMGDLESSEEGKLKGVFSDLGADDDLYEYYEVDPNFGETFQAEFEANQFEHTFVNSQNERENIVDIGLDINDQYDLALLLRYLRRSKLLQNVEVDDVLEI